MKSRRLLSFFSDLLFYSVSAVSAIAIITILLFVLAAGRDPVQFSEMLKNYLCFFSVGIYLVFIVIAYIYWVVIPQSYQRTLGMYIWRLEYSDNLSQKLFVYNLLMPFWRLLLFPLAIWYWFKDTDISRWVTDLKVQEVGSFDRKKFFNRLVIGHVIIGVLMVFGAFFIYREGVAEFLGRFSDYRTQVELYIEKQDWEQATFALEQFDHYHQGKDEEITYYSCIIAAGKQDWEKAAQECAPTDKLDDLDKEKRLAMRLTLADVYFNTSETGKALEIYQTVWNEEKSRDYELIRYAKLLSDQQKYEEAIQVIVEIISGNEDLSAEEEFTLDRLKANILVSSKKYKEATEQYQSLIKQLDENQVSPDELGVEKDSLLGELVFELAKSQYFAKDFKQAKENFQEAKKLNEAYTNIADSYIIDIDLEGIKQ